MTKPYLVYNLQSFLLLVANVWLSSQLFRYMAENQLKICKGLIYFHLCWRTSFKEQSWGWCAYCAGNMWCRSCCTCCQDGVCIIFKDVQSFFRNNSTVLCNVWCVHCLSQYVCYSAPVFFLGGRVRGGVKPLVKCLVRFPPFWHWNSCTHFHKWHRPSKCRRFWTWAFGCWEGQIEPSRG